MKQYTVTSNGKETKPFPTFEEAKNFALAWKGKFSIFMDLEVRENGEVVEII